VDLKLDEIHTYLACPAKYKFKFIDNIEMPYSQSIAFKKAIHETTYFFFYCAMNGWIPKPSQMKDKWANLWGQNTGDRDTLSMILKPTSSMEVKRTRPEKKTDPYLIKGMEMINNFYHFNNKNPGSVILVDQPYRLALDNVNIIGKFELIREILDAEDGKRYIEIVDFKTNDEPMDPFLVKHDFNLSLASLAFRNLFQSTEDRMKYHYLKTGRDIITVRRESDYNRAKATVKGVVNGIENKDFYPKQSFMCKSCEFRDVCDRVKY
jgi:CRISPR/Cas system-associated exonuclease Cas4 (RecB family)